MHVSFRRSDFFLRLRSDYARYCFPELLTDSLTNSLAIYPVYHWSSQRQAGSLPDAGSLSLLSLSLSLSRSLSPSPFDISALGWWVGVSFSFLRSLMLLSCELPRDRVLFDDGTLK